MPATAADHPRMSRIASAARLLWAGLAVLLLCAAPAMAKEKTAAERRTPSKPPTVQRSMKEFKRQAKRDRAKHRKMMKSFASKAKVRL